MKRQIFLVSLLAMVLLTGCHRKERTEGEETEKLGAVVSFSATSASFAVKAGETALPSGTEVGIFALSPLDKVNVKGLSSGETINPVTNIRWDYEQSVSTDFLCYLPYDEKLASASLSFSVPADQTSEAARKKADFCGARVTADPGTKVAFVLQHLLSQLVFSVSCEDSGESVQSVTVDAVSTTAEIDLQIPSATATSATTAVKCGKASGGYTAIIIPQTRQLSVTVVTSTGRSVPFQLEASRSFESGYAYKAALTVPAEAVEVPVSFSFTVQPWNDGGSLDFS